MINSIKILCTFLISSVFYSASGQGTDKFYTIASGAYNLSDENSTISFEISNLWLINADGSIGGLDGTLSIGNSLEDTDISFTLDVKTIETGIDKRDEHLRSEDFFYAEKYPQINFESTSIKQQNGDFPYVANGDLTIRGVTKKVSVPYTFAGMQEINGKQALTFKGETTLNRNDFNVDYSSPGLGDEVTVSFTIVGIKK